MRAIVAILTLFDRLGGLASSVLGDIRLFHILKIVSAICTQGASFYLVYVLSPEQYGRFALVATVAQLLYVLTSGWSNGVVINLGSQSFAQKGSYKSIVVYRLSIVGVMFILVGSSFILISPMVESYMNIKDMITCVMPLFIGYVFYDHASQLLYPANHDQVQAGAELLASLILLLIVVFAVQDLKEYIFSYVAVSVVFACSISFIFIKNFGRQRFMWCQTDFYNVLQYSGWQIISVICIYIINMGSNYIFLACHVPLDQIGLYNLSYRLYSGFAPIFSLFGILIPKWVHSSDDGIHTSKSKIFKINLVLAVLYLVSGLVLSPLLRAFEMQGYLESVKFFFLLFPVFVLTSYANLLNTLIANTHHYRRAQLGILIQSVLLIILSFPLVYKFGVVGAIVAMTAASAFGAIYFNRLCREALCQVKG